MVNNRQKVAVPVKQFTMNERNKKNRVFTYEKRKNRSTF